MPFRSLARWGLPIALVSIAGCSGESALFSQGSGELPGELRYWLDTSIIIEQVQIEALSAGDEVLSLVVRDPPNEPLDFGPGPPLSFTLPVTSRLHAIRIAIRTLGDGRIVEASADLPLDPGELDGVERVAVLVELVGELDMLDEAAGHTEADARRGMLRIAEVELIKTRPTPAAFTPRLVASGSLGLTIAAHVNNPFTEAIVPFASFIGTRKERPASVAPCVTIGKPLEPGDTREIGDACFVPLDGPPESLLVDYRFVADGRFVTDGFRSHSCDDPFVDRHEPCIKKVDEYGITLPLP